AAVLLFLLAPWPAGAAPIYWQLNGEIVYNPPDPPAWAVELNRLLSAGTDVTFLITVDPTAPNLCVGDPEEGGIFYLPAVTTSFDGHSYTGAGYLEANSIEGYCGSFENLVYRIRAGSVDFLTIEWYPGHLGALPPTVPPSDAGFYFIHPYFDP